MNRKLVLATIFPATFFLIFLGIRTSDFGKDSRSKPRPRAVVENIEQETKSTCDDQHQDVEPSKQVCVLSPASEFGFQAWEVPIAAFHAVGNPISRAPPSPSMQFS